MNQDIKARWVAALRSGDYPQGKGALNDRGKFCCLGVLCELAVHDGIVEAVEWGSALTGYRKIGAIGDPETGILLTLVKDWAGMAAADPCVHDAGRLLRRLSTINDDGVPFTVIADLIEEQL